MLVGSVKRQLKQAIPAYVIWILMIILSAVLSPDFRSVGNISNIILQATPLAIVAIGQSIILIMGGIDMSVGSVISFSTVIVATASNLVGGFGSFAVAVLAGLLVGIVNGLGVVYLKIPPLIMTISTGAIVKGLALLLLPSPGGNVSESLMSFFTASSGCFSVAGVFGILLYVIVTVFMHQTRTGRYLYATGGNPLHARQSGLAYNRLTILSYALAGLFAALAGIILAARSFSGDPVIGDTYNMDSVAAAVVGGISLTGGMGSVVGAFAGSYILAMINNTLNMLNVFAYYQYIIKGLILVLALLVFQLKRRKKYED